MLSEPQSGGFTMNIEPKTASTARTMLNKVPEATIFFWVVKIMATTVGETVSDYFNETLKFGLVGTFFLMAGLLVVALFAQFRLRQYVPAVYWLAVVLISIVGTLITDYLHDDRGIELKPLTAIFSVALIVSFGIWHASEKTLSIHSIFTTKRETFYWITILCSFALGTAAGDLLGEEYIHSFWKAALIFSAFIAAVAVAHFAFKLNAILAFWLAYIVTRPLGASIGDYLSQAKADGGLGWGTTAVSVVFLLTIVAVVGYLTKTKADVIETAS
jgi:uncharacterized membrane-anchored protein